MDDFKKQLEQAKLARMQGIRISSTQRESASPEPSVPPVRTPNRIEEALRTHVPSPGPVAPPTLQAQVAATEQPRESGGQYGSFLKKFFSVLFILILAAAGWYGYGFYKAHPRQPTPADVVAEVGKLVELPPGETPTVATISDLKPLAGEAFFKDAEVGDKVLIYATSSKAILYRPSTGRVIQVSPLNK